MQMKGLYDTHGCVADQDVESAEALQGRLGEFNRGLLVGHIAADDMEPSWVEFLSLLQLFRIFSAIYCDNARNSTCKISACNCEPDSGSCTSNYGHFSCERNLHEPPM